MVKNFVIRHRRRRRIARGLRLLEVTRRLAPPVIQIAKTVVNIYVRAWYG